LLGVVGAEEGIGEDILKGTKDIISSSGSDSSSSDSGSSRGVWK